MLTKRRRRWTSITSALGQCIVLSRKWPFWRRGMKASPAYSNASIPEIRDNLPMLFQCWSRVEDCGSKLKQHWVNVMCLLMCWCKVYIRPSVGLVLGQRRGRLTVIDPAMGCDAGPTLNRNLVGRPISYTIVETRGKY